MEYLDKQQENFCENAGLFGVLIGITCLIQHFVFMLPHWISFTLIAVYIFCIVAFALLMKKVHSSPLLLLISACLIFIVEVFMILQLTFSPVIVVLLIYAIVITVLLYMGTIPVQLKKRNEGLKKDAAEWQNVL